MTGGIEREWEDVASRAWQVNPLLGMSCNASVELPLASCPTCKNAAGMIPIAVCGRLPEERPAEGFWLENGGKTYINYACTVCRLEWACSWKWISTKTDEETPTWCHCDDPPEGGGQA